MDNAIIVIGLGSMGKRRIRNLKALGHSNIVGVDKRPDRRDEVVKLHDIETFSELDEALKKLRPVAFVISVPPDAHHTYMKKAVSLSIPAFIEASVVDTDLAEVLKAAKEKKVFLAPSCTLYFHPAIKKIKEILSSKELGVVSNILYHSGQYLPDWHTYEHVRDYYVSNKATGGGREIVPFELTWITLIFGLPQRVVGFYKKTIEIEGAPDIDDTYNILLDYKSMIFNLSVDVVSRYATRRLVINGQNKQLYWNWDDNVIRIYDPEKNVWKEISYDILSAQSGYNKNITEQMYIDEMNAFINAFNDHSKYPNSLEHDLKVLNLLYASERSDNTNAIQVL